MFTFENDRLVGQAKYPAVGFTAKAWHDAGLDSLNDQAWEMRMDFSFPSNQVMADRGTGLTHSWNEYMYLQFDRGTNIGQQCDACMSLGNSGSGGNDLTYIQGSADFRSLVQHYDTPFSWIVSRDADTGYINLKLYRRDTEENLVEAEIRRDVEFNDLMDNSRVPFAMYVNNMVIDYDGFHLTAGGKCGRGVAERTLDIVTLDAKTL
jgi:hypothetical protein